MTETVLKKKIRVLHIIKSLGRGGAEMLLPETIAVHDRNLFEFHVIYFLPWKNQMVEAIQKTDSRVTCFPASNNIQILMQYRKVLAYVKQYQIDVIHAHLPWAGFLSRIIHRTNGIPVLYTEHNKQERYHFLTKLLNRISFNWQTAGVAVSEEVAISIKKNIHPEVPVQTILNGINTHKFHLIDSAYHETRKAIRSHMGIPEDAIVIGTMAVFRFQKRLELWMEVFVSLKKRFPNLKGIIVGDGPLKEQILVRRKELDLEDAVFLPGLQTNPIDWLSTMDVYMMSSVFEGLPIALLEAMSCGLPVVCTNAGGTGEVIRDGIDGALTPVDEPMLLVDKIAALINDSSLRQRMGVASRMRVVESFSMERMVGELEELYRKVAH